MRKKQRSKWILFLAALASFFMLGGCSLGESFEDALANRNLTAQVTYYSNGGMFEGTPEKKEMYYKSGSKALNIGVVNPTSGTVEITRNNYVFDGWYYAVLDDNGAPIYEDAQAKTYKLGEKVDFSVCLQEGDHWIVVAKWLANVKVNVVLACDADAEIPVKVKAGEEAKSYKNGDVVAVRTYDTKDEVVNPGEGKAPFTVQGKGYTFVEYYLDEACTSLVQWPIKKQEADVTVYAKYIAGEWDVVRTSRDVSSMFNSITTGARYWLVKDVDATGIKIAAKTIFDGEIQGNVFTISNLTVQKSQITANSNVSFFGEIQSTAIIENLTLDGLTFIYSLVSAPVNIYFVFTSIAEGARINGVQLSGEMTVTKGEQHFISNLVNGYENCLFGGFATDAEYLTQTNSNGFTVVGNPEQFIKINTL